MKLKQIDYAFATWWELKEENMSRERKGLYVIPARRQSKQKDYCSTTALSNVSAPPPLDEA